MWAVPTLMRPRPVRRPRRKASWAKNSDALCEGPVHLQLRVLPAQPRQLKPLGLPQSPVTGLLADPVGLDPVAQRLPDNAELTGPSGDHATGVDHQPHGLVLVRRSQLTALTSHDEHPPLRNVERTEAKPG